MINQKPKIALFLGGTSPERAISKSTGESIYKALSTLGYETILIDPAYGRNQPKNIEDFFTQEDYTKISNRNYVEAVNSKLLENVDLAFLALHGKWGEDGTIQSLLELRGIKYTGSKVLASSISMDKIMSKILFRHYDINTPEWISVHTDAASKSGGFIEMIKNSFGFPCVIKPNDQGSTVGLTICRKEAEVKDAVELALQYSDKALIEEYIPGHEITVGILENNALPVLKIKPKHGLYDYECKYTSGMSEYEVPANLPKQVYDKLQSQALLAFNSLRCESYARIDFRLSERNETYCLEVNTLPGMTSTSLVPKMAKAVGMTFEQLIERIISLSL